MLRGLSGVLRVVAKEEQSAVDLRMKGLHPAVHHLGESREIGDLLHGDACGGDRLGGASGGEEFDTEFMEAAGEVDEAGLVGDREEGALDFHEGKVFVLTRHA